MSLRLITIITALFMHASVFAQSETLLSKTDELAEQIEDKVIQWRRHLHEHPELSNREFKTAEMVAEHLRGLGIEVKTGIAHTGVVGILKGGKPGPVVGLRADMDALPVTERVDVPFASKVRATYNNVETGVMHACGHDSHVAILMGVAEVLSQIKDELQGTVKFVFQPAEEGAPKGEEGGADLMIKEGVMKDPDIDVMYGLHINSKMEAGKIGYRPEGTMAAVDRLEITVKGAQTHGAYPWDGVDPIVVSSQIVLGLQTIVSRQTKLIQQPAVITVGLIQGGVRNNIIPEEVRMIGTIRTLDNDMQDLIHEKIRLTATKIAESAGATAEVDIIRGYPVTFNDPELTAKSVPVLEEVIGKENVFLRDAVTGAEDFSYYSQVVPGFFFFLGGRDPQVSEADAAPHHTPDFYIDESGFVNGVKAFVHLTLDYMANPMN